MYDGYSCHSSDYFLDECTYRDIIPFLEPPSSSDQVQVLDIGVLGVQKTLKKSIAKNDSLNTNSNKITSIFDSWLNEHSSDSLECTFIIFKTFECRALNLCRKLIK